MRKKDSKEYLVQSVLNAMAILEQFHDDVEELSLSQLSRCTSLSKNTVFRLLATLEARSYVEQNRSNERYRLGIKSYELGNVRLRQTELMEKCRPVMERLAADTSETVSLAVGVGAEIYYADFIISKLPVRFVILDRMRLYPAHATAAGKAMLARRWANSDLPTQFAGRLVPRAPRTITDPEILLRELQIARATGYAIDNEEAEPGARSVAAPILDHNNEFVAALCVTGPVLRFSMDRIEGELAPLVVRCAQHISSELGHPGEQPDHVRCEDAVRLREGAGLELLHSDRVREGCPGI